MKIALVVIALLFVLVSAYVRLAPLDVPLLQSWMSLFPPGEKTWVNGHQVVREMDDPQAEMARLDAIIMATPRTTRVQGSVESGLTSYVTRSALFGFPDFITLSAGPDDTIDGGNGPLLRIDGRAVYGKSDLGVNKARIQGWLAQLDGDRPTQ